MQIDFVTKREFSELLAPNPHLHHVFPFDAAGGFSELRRLKRQLQNERYDLIVDIHNSLRSRYVRYGLAPTVVKLNKRIFERTVLVKMHRNIYHGITSVAERYIEPVKRFGVVYDGNGLDFFIPENTKSKIAAMPALKDLRSFDTVIGFCPGARHATKRWETNRFCETGIRIARELHAGILLFGGPDDALLCQRIASGINTALHTRAAIDVSGTLSLCETAAAMQMCSVVLTNDTGLMHIAAATKRKVVALFGSTVQEFGFFPFGTTSTVLEVNGLSCRPCSHIGRSSCPKKHFRCMKDIQMEQAVQAVASMLTKE
jgi:heptosyltransferase-2